MFRPVRQPNPEYLYNSGDTHWAVCAMRIVAKEIAARMRRYEFGRKAQQGAPVANVIPRANSRPAARREDWLGKGLPWAMAGTLYPNVRRRLLQRASPAATRS